MFGDDNVARLLSTILPAMLAVEITFEPHEVNGQPGAIFRDHDGRVLNTWTLDVVDGRIQAIRNVLNPDKLRHVGPVADAWPLLRQASELQRPAE